MRAWGIFVEGLIDQHLGWCQRAQDKKYSSWMKLKLKQTNVGKKRKKCLSLRGYLTSPDANYVDWSKERDGERENEITCYYRADYK